MIIKSQRNNNNYVSNYHIGCFTTLAFVNNLSSVLPVGDLALRPWRPEDDCAAARVGRLPVGISRWLRQHQIRTSSNGIYVSVSTRSEPDSNGIDIDGSIRTRYEPDSNGIDGSIRTRSEPGSNGECQKTPSAGLDQ